MKCILRYSCNQALLPSLSLLLLLLFVQTALAQVANPKPYGNTVLPNFIRVWEARSPQSDLSKITIGTPVDSFAMTTQYFDGLARPVQTVAKSLTPAGMDLVTPQVYDTLGREQYKFLPFAANATGGNTSLSDGLFKLNPFQQDSAFSKIQYPGETYYYDQTGYETSPLNRIQKTWAPGNNWAQGSGNRPVQQQYLTNTAGDSVRIWTVAPAIGAIPSSPGSYAAGQLMKNLTFNEQSQQQVEYKDKEGKTVLKKVQLAASPGTGHAGWLNTYYIYDSLNNLRCVIQPRGVEWLLSNSWSLSAAGDTLFTEQCFRYEYDKRNRIIVKKIPGAGELWLVYDARDRMVMSQDSVLRSKGKWAYTNYDSLNRPYLTGLWTISGNRTYHQGYADTSITYPTPVSSYEVLTQTYYDDYSWDASNISGLGADVDSSSFSNSSYFITAYNTSPQYSQRMSRSRQTRGLVTGTKTKVLESTNTYLYTKNFYDDRNRLIQTRSINVTAAIDTVSQQYDFTGKPLRTRLQHKKGGTLNVQTHTVLTKVEYDPASRLKRVWKNIDNAPADQLIDSLQYNELGQLQNKYLGAGMDNLTYSYNIRGWLTTINKDYVSGASTSNYFGMELGYDKTSTVAGTTTYATPQFNGNISGTIWKTRGDGIGRKYDFTYDNANRLVNANFVQNTTGTAWDSTLINFGVSKLTYDANGNIQSMWQKGFKVGGSDLIDKLTYTYQKYSNKLSIVNDDANDPQSQLGDFHYSGNKQLTDYGYDGNGNLVLDNNKAMSAISYNYLNLPQQVSVTGKGTITYTYDAAGNKLAKTTVDNTPSSAKTTITQYIGGIIYQNDTMQLISHEEGRIRWAKHYYQGETTKYGWETDFFEKDHLGNTRVVLTTQKDTGFYAATMEPGFRIKENALFYNISQTSYSRTTAGYPADFSMTPTNDSVIMLNGLAGRIQGPAIILKIMAGDSISLGVKNFYTTQSGMGTNPSFTDVLASLADGLVGITGGGKGSVSDLKNPISPVYGALNSFITNKDTSIASKPRAYLNWMLFDNQFQYDATRSGALAVGSYPVGTLNTIAPLSGIVAGKSGFLYVWVSNETQNWPVFFDNLSIRIFSSPLVEETHYYPFGLTMAGISDKAIKAGYVENKFRYNKGSELQNKEFSDGSGLEMYDTHFRNLDPQLGRWWQLDPKPSDEESPYASFKNNPILHNDPLGDTARYYDNTGKVLYQREDGSKRITPTIISNKNLKAFNTAVAGGKSTIAELNKFGAVYDTKSFSDFFVKNRNIKATSVDGIPVNKISNLKIDGKPTTTSMLHSEVVANTILKNGTVTLGNNAPVSLGDVTGGDPDRSGDEPGKVAGIHLHPTAGTQTIDFEVRYGPISSGHVITLYGGTPSSADYNNAGRSNNGYRQVLVDSKYIYLYNSNASETIKIPRQ